MIGSGKGKKTKWLTHARQSMERRGTVGSFTAQAQKAGMGVQEYADKVLAPGSHASTTTKRRANFAKNV